MILCVNLNAAVDKTVRIENFQLGCIHRPSSVMLLPGGKGINVARILKALGEQPVVTGWIGGLAGDFIEAGLRKEGLDTAFARTSCESRTCLSIIDTRQNILTEIYEKGDPIPPDAIHAFIEVYTQALIASEVVTLSGSLPPGIPEDFYASLLILAREAGVPTLLDTSGAALKAGVEYGRPMLIKPNRSELASLVTRKIGGIDEVVTEASDLSSRHQMGIVVSLGAEGLIAVSNDQVWHARPPEVKIISAVGSGDAVLASLAYGIKYKLSFEESLRLGVAAGTANAMTVGAGKLSLKDLEQIRPLVQMSNLDQ